MPLPPPNLSEAYYWLKRFPLPLPYLGEEVFPNPWVDVFHTRIGPVAALNRSGARKLGVTYRSMSQDHLEALALLGTAFHRLTLTGYRPLLRGRELVVASAQGVPLLRVWAKQKPPPKDLPAISIGKARRSRHVLAVIPLKPGSHEDLLEVLDRHLPGNPLHQGTA